MKKLLLLCACLLALAAPLRAAVAPPEIVVVRIFEFTNSSSVIITRGEGKSEELKFDRGLYNKNIVASTESYYKVFAGLYQEGYAVQSTFTAVGSAGNVTTLLFIKAQ